MDSVQTAKYKKFWWREEEQQKRVCAVSLQPGQPCPLCEEALLAYDGLFMLTCPACGHVAESGAFT